MWRSISASLQYPFPSLRIGRQSYSATRVKPGDSLDIDALTSCCRLRCRSVIDMLILLRHVRAWATRARGSCTRSTFAQFPALLVLLFLSPHPCLTATSAFDRVIAPAAYARAWVVLVLDHASVPHCSHNDSEDPRGYHREPGRGH